MKIYADISKFNFCSELLILGGLLKEIPKQSPENEGRFNGIIEICNNIFEYVETEDEADVVVIPYKFNGTFPETDKPVLAFYNDDDSTTFELPDNVKLFRTSLYASKRLPNEFAIPTVSPDYFDGHYLNNPKLSVGFCGHSQHGRYKYLNMLYQSNIDTNFIIRNGYWAPGVNKLVARNEYIKNISNNIFTFCYRGVGNFSYRFYEILMMGRIPVIIDTDCVFPIDIKELCVYCLPDDDIVQKIKDFYINKNLLEVQRNNRKVWEEKLSPIGWLKTLKNEYNLYQ